MINKVFIIGKIVSEIQFDFIYGSKNKISIVRFNIELQNKSIVKARAYNEIADEIYSNKEQNDTIVLEGKINSNMEIEIQEIY